MRPTPTERVLIEAPPARRGVLLLALALVILAALGALVTLAFATSALAAAGDPATDPSVGFPVALAGLALAATAFALVWRAVSRRRSSR